MPKLPIVFFILECKHNAAAKVTHTSVNLFCGHCQEWRQIRGINLREWHIGCRSCSFGRWAGMDRSTAELLANAHFSKNPSHAIIDVEFIDYPEAHKLYAKWRSHHVGT